MCYKTHAVVTPLFHYEKPSRPIYYIPEQRQGFQLSVNASSDRSTWEKGYPM